MNRSCASKTGLAAGLALLAWLIPAHAAQAGESADARASQAPFPVERIVAMAQHAPSAADPAAVAYPFGAHRWAYNPAAILPNRDRAKMDKAVLAFYRHWKSQYLARTCGGWVVKGGQERGIGVSEGQGYGMMILPVMAGADPQAREIFDGIFRFTRMHPSKNSPHLMSWIVGHDCQTLDPYPAADGDLDIAFGLLMADRQWGSDGPIDYRAEAVRIIDAIRDGLTLKEGYIGNHPPDLTRTSDFMPGHFRAFLKATGDRHWERLIDRGYELMDYLQARHAPRTGLIPDFAVAVDTGQPVPSPGGRLESMTEGFYAWNAGRNPWRLASDYIVSGDPRARVVGQKMIDFFKASTGGNPRKIRATYRLDGTVDGNYEHVFFQAPIGAGAMLDPSNQKFLDALWDHLANRRKGGDYYGETVQLLSMIVMSGNWFQP